MTFRSELCQSWADQFIVLILDNEVTVSHFVTSPPLPWTRLVQRQGLFQAAEGYPNVLTPAQARFEMRNWDEVSLPAIMRAVTELDDSVDYVLIGNNAGQGLSLAGRLALDLAGERAAIIYANSLPEKSAYERFGYRFFFRRNEAVTRMLGLAKSASRPAALCFINTIQHNERNYHDP